MYSREMVISCARGLIGAVQGDSKHKYIIDTYNAYISAEKGKKHRGSSYKVKYSDAWCATFVSACAVMAKCEDIIPTECSCTRMIKLFDSMGCYERNDNYKPAPGDIIFYRWNIDGKDIPSEAYDVDGISHHVGIVEECNENTITVIEGNYNSKCQRRKIKVGWKYIHGFGIPKYSDVVEKKPIYYTVKRGENLSIIAHNNNTTIDNILKLNPEIKNKNLILAGQVIRIG